MGETVNAKLDGLKRRESMTMTNIVEKRDREAANLGPVRIC